MKIRAHSVVEIASDGKPSIAIYLGDGEQAQRLVVPIDTWLDNQAYERTASEPAQLSSVKGCPTDGLWLFKGHVVEVHGSGSTASVEVPVRVKHTVYRLDRSFERIHREVAAFENASRLAATPREAIPEYVRLFVWQRDAGKCVTCGSRERLEFDHIIPLARGGSNTERNLQLLCEACNRAKAASI
jgi:hypothetical protein